LAQKKLSHPQSEKLVDVLIERLSDVGGIRRCWQQHDAMAQALQAK
jgi:hypothetical protein